MVRKGLLCCCREEYIAMGLFHVAKAVSFLNNDCKQVWHFSLISVCKRVADAR